MSWAKSTALRRRGLRRAVSGLSDGYTLLEVLVVLVVLGLILGFAGLRVDQYQSTITVQNQARAVQAQFRSLQTACRAAAQSCLADEAWITSLKEKSAFEPTVSVEVVTPIQIASDGLCSAGALRFAKNEARVVLTIARPWCDAVIERVP